MPLRMDARIATISMVNSLLNNEILGRSKLNAFEHDNLNMNQKLKFALGRVENNVGKGENAGTQHFLLFPFSHYVFKRPVS